MPSQKIQVPEKFLSAVQKIIAHYPKYIETGSLVQETKEEKTKNKGSIRAFLQELAFLQIIVVQWLTL